jgi:hypothetical protein
MLESDLLLRKEEEQKGTQVRKDGTREAFCCSGALVSTGTGNVSCVVTYRLFSMRLQQGGKGRNPRTLNL